VRINFALIGALDTRITSSSPLPIPARSANFIEARLLSIHCSLGTAAETITGAQPDTYAVPCLGITPPEIPEMCNSASGEPLASEPADLAKFLATNIFLVQDCAPNLL